MTRRGSLSFAVPAALAAASLLGCIGDPDAPDLEAYRIQWKKNEPALFAYTVNYICFCPGGPVHVLAGRESVLVAKSDGDGFGPATGVLYDVPSPQSYSIDSLFDEVEGNLRIRHDSRRVSFDPTYGFPAEVHIDFEKRAVDEEFGLVISDFRAVSALPQPIEDGVVTMTVKPYLALCSFFQPWSYGCPVISLNGGPFAKSVSGIKGLDFEWGKEKTLQVEVKNTPAEWQDVPPFEYTLIRETASVPVDSARFDIVVGPGDRIRSVTDPAGGGVLRIADYREIAYPGAFPLDMNGEHPAKTAMLTLEMKAGALRLVSALVIP